MKIQLTREHYQQMVLQARREFPLECCGLLAGTKTKQGVSVEKLYPLTNIDQSSEHFSLDPKEQFAALKQMRAEGMELVGNYHSHPASPSRPSEEDKRLAYDSNTLYAILSLKDEEPVLNFFKITNHETVEKLEYLLV